jgi:hypothetical protein
VAGAGRTLTSFGTLVADVWVSATRTLTSFAGADFSPAWAVLTATLTTAGSIGKLILDKLGLITTAGQVTVASPVIDNGTLVNIIIGDTYWDDSTGSHRLRWDFSSIPDLTGHAFTFVMSLADGTTFSKAVTVEDADTVRLDLTAAETAGTGWAPGNRPYTIWGTIDAAAVITPILSGTVRLYARMG